MEKLHQFLREHYKAFCLDPDECEETDLVITMHMEIDTGEAWPTKQAADRMPLGSGQK